MQVKEEMASTILTYLICITWVCISKCNRLEELVRVSMIVCEYVCTWNYICMWKYICMHVYMSLYVCVYEYDYMSKCVCECVCVHIRVCRIRLLYICWFDYGWMCVSPYVFHRLIFVYADSFIGVKWGLCMSISMCVYKCVWICEHKYVCLCVWLFLMCVLIICLSFIITLVQRFA